MTEDIPMEVQIQNPPYKEVTSIYEFMAKDLRTGDAVKLEKYQGKVCLIVNTARKCGLAPSNFKQLSELHDTYSDKGLCILAFPSNQFNMEPGSNEDVLAFIESQNIQFPVFQKILVNTEDGHPLYKYLKLMKGGILGDFIKWNFTKFIVDRRGIPVERHGPNVDPNELTKQLEVYLTEEIEDISAQLDKYLAEEEEEKTDDVEGDKEGEGEEIVETAADNGEDIESEEKVLSDIVEQENDEDKTDQNKGEN